MYWCIDKYIEYRFCEKSRQSFVYHKLNGTIHLINELASFALEQCKQKPQTMDAILGCVAAIYEADQPSELVDATMNAVRQLQALGILTPCQPSSAN
jgi:PqqD family protein of HPr-rel-A system